MAITRKPSVSAPEPVVQPTEQVPFEPTPMAARSAVNRGKTGLGSLTADDTATSASKFGGTGVGAGTEPAPRRHLLSSDITVGILLIVAVSALTAWGVGTAVAASVASNTTAVAALSTSTPTAVPATGAATATASAVFRATIQSMDGSSWTVLTRSGRTLTVAITDSTRFGTKRVTESENTFADGDDVVVVATRAAGTIIAVRVAEAASGSQPAPIPTPTSTTTT